MSKVALPFLLAFALLVAAGWWWRRHPEQFSPLLSLFLAVVSTLAGAAGGVVLDGNISDWSGVAPAVTSPQSGPVDADMLAVYWQKDASNVYFRIDADVRADTSPAATITVSAGAGQSITLPAAASLIGSATRNPAGALTLAWSKTTGPGTVTFATPTLASTSATFSQSGSYGLTLTATDGANSNSATVTVTVADAPQSPTITVNAGAVREHHV